MKCPRCNLINPTEAQWCDCGYEFPKIEIKDPDKKQSSRPLIVMPLKSVGISIILTIFFGPLGMFYSTIKGGIIMLIISFFFGLITMGYGLIILWPICIIWGAMATDKHNKELLER